MHYTFVSQIYIFC